MTRSPALIRDLPAEERPRERLRDAGAGALSNAELLAILLRTGTPRESAVALGARLLAEFGGIAGMARAPFQELCAIHGLGEAKAAQLKAAIELGVRAAQTSTDARNIVRSPDDIGRLMAPELSLLDREQVRVVLLDARNHVISIVDAYQGSAHTAQVRIGELLQDAVRVNASAIVLVHNHPSGDPAPSAADIAMTGQLYEACRLMDIDLFDHVVVAGGRWVSMRLMNLGFPPDAR